LLGSMSNKQVSMLGSRIAGDVTYERSIRHDERNARRMVTAGCGLDGLWRFITYKPPRYVMRSERCG
jgi:hypothetical protein